MTSQEHDWKVEHWGTKWEANADYCEPATDGSNYYHSFTTAWAPPIGVLQKLSELMPNATFILNYDETGMDFMGTAVARNGELLDKNELVTPYREDWEQTTHPELVKKVEQGDSDAEDELNDLWFDEGCELVLETKQEQWEQELLTPL